MSTNRISGVYTCEVGRSNSCMVQKYRLVPLVHAKKPLGPPSRLERCFGRCMLWILPIPGGRGLVTGNGCLPHSARYQPLPERTTVGPFIFWHRRDQPQRRRHCGRIGTMGSPCRISCLDPTPSVRVPHLVDCTRTQTHHQKAVKQANSRKSSVKRRYFLVLINNLHRFIHEMTGSPCQR